MPDSAKPTSLLCNRISYNCKKFKSTGPKACFSYLLTANIKIGWECLTVTNLLGFLCSRISNNCKKFKRTRPKSMLVIFTDKYNGMVKVPINDKLTSIL